ncbi:recombinase family protein [Kocuria rosea]|uniref:recombinase family protein n=1 Tax=Kocuria rosea TaxID=1275 RepID=UPI002B24C8FD|nr:recombinase family protein [Kocuria rosea]MEB2529114.1 recombinase family protein [Kocuria rosea]MEB2619446.1 recombinase family protein [Kocuria rosea]
MARRTQTVGYVRVSSAELNAEEHKARQLERIGEVDRLFVDKISGASRSNRTALVACMTYVRQGDVVLVASMDRLARSLRDLQTIIEEFHLKGATVRFLREDQICAPDADDTKSRLMLNLLGSFAEFERTLIRERQIEGVAIATATGSYKNRARKLRASELEEARRFIAQGVPRVQIARELGVNRSTLYRALASYPEDQSIHPIRSVQ